MDIMSKIIDIHNHSLPGVDDGSKGMLDSVENIRFLNSIGITDIVLTSHYIEDSDVDIAVPEREKILERLKMVTKNIPTKCYLGNEVYICENILNLLDKKEITTINDSRYLLLELPFFQTYHGLDDIICELNANNIIPIIAHPERYRCFQENSELLTNILEYDCYLQGNIGSIAGQYGRTAKRLFKSLLKNKLITFVGTDLHHISQEKYIKKGLSMIKRATSKDYYDQITYLNSKAVLNDEEIISRRMEKV